MSMAGRIIIAVAVSAAVWVFHSDLTSDLNAQSAPRVFEVDRSRSNVFVVTHRSGLFSFLAHDHAILATEWSATLCWTDAYTLRGAGTIQVAAQGLVIDSDSARGLARLGAGPSPGQARDLQQKILTQRYLAAATYPRLTLDRVQVYRSSVDRLEVQGVLTIRDRSLPVRFPVEISGGPDGVHLRGVLKVRQSDFGIRPESVARVVRVADQVDIHFDLLESSARMSCDDE